MRPIDGDALEEIVLDGLKEVPHNDGLARRHHKAEHIHFLDLIRRAPTIAPPPNDPLTPEEMREMGGEPYWHVGLQDESPSPHWSILEPYFAKNIENYGYGKRWLAYRRKLEGEI